jgi:electron transport complex protein RnfD
MNSKLRLSPAPHLRSGESIERIMYWVVIALLPALAWSIYVFGLPALKVILITTVTAVVVEYIIQRTQKMRMSYLDGSAIITGLLLAMNLPSSAPWWMCILGAVIAIGLGKMVFGGLGNNIFNPALVARVVLFISFPVQMTHWPLPFATDAVSSATPLGVLGTSGALKAMETFPLMDMFLGRIGGCLGEVSALMLILGGLILLFKGYIKWDIPVSFIATTAIIVYIINLINPGQTASVPFHLLSGGLMIGAIFMATDMVTSPLTTKGRLVFGFGCGLLTALIRVYGSFPEGVSFAILLMNAMTPTIDRYFRPRIYGTGRRK